VHGVLEDAAVLEELTGRRPVALDTEFDALADAVDAHLDLDWLAQRLLART
jgi:hypothetical protein